MSVSTALEPSHGSSDPNGKNGGTSTLLVLQLKPIATFKTNDEYLYAMKEDLADWFTCLYKLTITVDNFFEVLETGVMLCEHANKVRRYATERTQKGIQTEMHSNFIRDLKVPQYEVQYRVDVRPQTFQARDNISQFITWTKKLGIPDVLCFETDDLVLRKNEKSVVLCLLEIARVGAKLGMLAPTLVQMEEEIDKELATGEPPKQIKTCDIKSLHEMVQELAGRCTCPVQFPIIKVGEGKYKIGDSQTLVFVRILRNHVMIRVGGGWDTLEHYLDKHDPCRCGFSGHRQSRAGGTPARRASTTAVSQSVPTTPRSPRKMSVQPSSVSTNQRPPSPARMRSMSPSPASSPKKIPSQPVRKVSMSSESIYSNQISDSSTEQKSISNNTRRSQSPVPNKFRSPSPVSYSNKPSQVTTTTTGGSRSQVLQVARPASPVKSTVSVPRRCTSPSPARRCVSPGPSRHCVSPGPSRRNTSLSTPRSSMVDDRRHLPQRPSMDSSGNDSEETDVTSGSASNQNNLSLDQISTMTLDEFKSLLNNALSVPNGNTSEGSLDSPRSQSSTDSFKHTYTGRSNKKPPLGEATQKYRTWANRKDASRSFDTGNSAGRQDKILKSTQSSDEYYELDRPSKKSSAVARPKTPVSSVSRPKTPVSSVPRPKTPVSSVPRPKTPVSVNSVSRPKTPTSQFRSTTPVSVSRQVTGSVPRPSPGVTRQPSGPPGTGRSKTPTRFQNSRVESESSSTGNVTRHSHDTKPGQRASSLNRTFGEQSRNELPSCSLIEVASDEHSDNSLNVSGSRTLLTSKSDLSSDTPSSRSERIAEIRARLAASRYGTDSGSATSTAPPASSSSAQYRKESFEPASHVSPKPEQTSPNVSYVSITSDVVAEAESSQDSNFSKTYQAMRQLSSGSIDPKPMAYSGSDVSLSVRSDGSYQSSSIGRSYGSSRQSSLSSVDSSPKEDLSSVQTDKINRTQSLDDNFIKRAQIDVGNEIPIVPVMNSPDERLVRPSTPARPSTPSLIPRPCTPLSSLKDSINNLEKQLAYSGQNHVSQTNSGRPPTPRKATILAKAPSAANTPKTSNASNNNSYTKMFLAKRSSTPGPTPNNASVSTPRRSRTPGPGDRDRNFSMPSQKSIKDTQSDSCGNGAVDQLRAQNVSASPVPQRKARTPSIEHRSLSVQNSVEGETVLTVNRSGGRHVLSVCDTKATKTPRSNGGRILARAASASQNQKPSSDVDRSRSRARTVRSTSSSLRMRPRSVDPESAVSRNAEENVFAVQRGEHGPHFVNNRTEAWVESAAKNTKAKTPTKSLSPKSVGRRCKTPNPRDIHEHELESRPLEEIKAALSLPINGLKEVDLDDLDAPPEDADAYAKMDELFRRLKAKELRASVNETPGGHGDLTKKVSSEQDDSDVASGDVCSLDSNENVKRKSSKSSYKSSPSSSNRGSTASTPSRPKTPSFPPKDLVTPHHFTRANSMPPRPSTPTRSSISRKSSSNSVHSAPAPETNIKRSVSDHTSMLVSKIKELINTKPRKDDKSGPRSKIPAPKSLSAVGKSKSVSNLISTSNLENISPNKVISNGDLSQTYDCNDDVCGEISKYSAHDQLDYNSYNGTVRNGTETPVPKLSTPLTTGRKEFLNNQKENTRTLVRAVSIGSLSSSSNTLSCNIGDDDDFV